MLKPDKQAKYKRVLLKLSGEALVGDHGFGIDPKVLDRMALEIGQLVGIGVQVGLVLGGGNLLRGATWNDAGRDRVTGTPRAATPSAGVASIICCRIL